MTSIYSSQIVEHMDVIAADGENIGKVDHLQASRIKLTKNSSPDGQHHFVPLDWIDHVDKHVHLNKTLADIRAQASLHSAETEAVPDAGNQDAAPR
jgi:hypothetical protein